MNLFVPDAPGIAPLGQNDAKMTPTVFVVDDDPGVRDSLELLISTQGIRVCTFDDPQRFLASAWQDEIGCIVLDIRMPHINGLQLQERLNAEGCKLPIIFITGHGDIEQCTRAFKEGAADFLTKPVDTQRLLDNIRKAIRHSIQLQRQENETQEVLSRLSRISDREREVLDLVAQGLSSKEIARELALSPRTIEAHRASLFAKLEVSSLAELIRFYLRAIGPH